MKWNEIVYMICDELKLSSDDSHFNNDHIMFLVNKYRSFILKQRYSDIKKQIPESNYQTLCLNLMEVPAIAGECCEGGSFLKSVKKVPTPMKIGVSRVYPHGLYDGEITYVSRDRMRYVGHNKYMKNVIYCAIAPDKYLYFKSKNSRFLLLENVDFTGIFEDAIEAFQLEHSSGEESCNIMNSNFPMEDALIPAVIELVVKELRSAEYLPEDKINNADDQLSEVNIKR